MSDRFEVWSTKKPILNTLPGLFACYRDNEPTMALTAYWDELLIDSLNAVESLEVELNPLTCDEKYLNFLGRLHGFINDYEILFLFSIEHQRLIISRSLNFIWLYKGSKSVIDFLLECLNICYRLFNADNSFKADINAAGDNLGDGDFSYINYFIVPFDYETVSKEFISIKRIIELFAPVYSLNVVTYPIFKAGISNCGMVLFDVEQSIICNIQEG